MDIVNEIVKLKSDGLKINEIASRLNIPVGTVKSKLFRYKANKEQDVKTPIRIINEKNLCKMCGSKIEQVSGKKTREFCSDYCRVKYWRKQKNDKK